MTTTCWNRWTAAAAAGWRAWRRSSASCGARNRITVLCRAGTFCRPPSSRRFSQGARRAAASTPAADLDVILGGHEHDPLVAEERKTLITKAGSDARYLVQIDLWLTREGKLVERSWRFREVSPRVAPDPSVAELVRAYAARFDRELDVVVGRTDVPLEARTSRLRTQETNA